MCGPYRGHLWVSKGNEKRSMTPAIKGRLYGNVATIVTNKLYFASFIEAPEDEDDTYYLCIDEEVHYDPFYTDFGPLNQSVIYRFSTMLNKAFEAITDDTKVVAYTNACPKARVNGACLIGCYVIAFYGMSADKAYIKLKMAEPPHYIGFRDAAMGEPSYLLHIHDVLKSFEKALKYKWMDFNRFDADEYEFYEKVENGDFNWIIPNKILSFCGPHNKSYIDSGYLYHAPETYFDYFHEHNITTIIRLNRKIYDAQKFTDAGFDHHDLFFIDGSTPSEEIVRKFISIVENSDGAVAIHCKAGLGRTGTLIACWMMKHFRITAPEAMAWIRICRPGSVIGPQQQFLIEKQQWCSDLRAPVTKTSSSRRKQVFNRSPSISPNCPTTTIASRLDGVTIAERTIRPLQQRTPVNGTARLRPTTLPRYLMVSGNNNFITPMHNGFHDETAINEYGQTQGDRLLAIKASRKPLIATTAKFSSPTTPIKPMALVHERRSLITNGNGPIATTPSGVTRNLLSKPISRVTVSSTQIQSSSLLPRNGQHRTSPACRIRPYPPQTTMPAKRATPTKFISTSTKAYDLRPRNGTAAAVASARVDLIRTLPPNTAALVGRRAKK